MLEKNRHKIVEIREMAVEIIDSLINSQTLIVQAIENCEADSYKMSREPLENLDEQVEKIDQAIITVCALYSPEAKDLREMIAFLKITLSLQRIIQNEKKYIDNMYICNPNTQDELRSLIIDTLTINRCTISALGYAKEMMLEIKDKDRLKDLANKIVVEGSKTDDIYTLTEKNILQTMHAQHELNEEKINLLKYVRKNLKIIERLEDIATKLIFARIGGQLI